MKFNETLDVDAPAEFTFSELADYETIERMVIERGVALRRTDEVEGPAAGMEWVADWEFKGREMSTEISMTEFQPPERMVLETQTAGIHGRVELRVEPLAPEKCRIHSETVLTASGIAAKMLMQPIKLARGTIEAKVAGRIGSIATRIERRYEKSRAS